MNNNKLRAIKPNIEPSKTCYSKSREWEIKLSRLRIGHIRLTHEYLMIGDNQRYCPDCIVPLTIYHIIMECSSLVESRRKYLGQPQQLKEVLGDEGPVLASGSLYSLLVETNIIDKIKEIKV